MKIIDFSSTTSDPYPQYLTPEEGNQSFAPIAHNHSASAITSGQLAIANGGTGASTAPAALTNLGAAAASHTHTGEQITGNISGSAGNITGIAAIANGGTGASTAPAALTNLGAAAAAHTHAASAIDSGQLAIANGGTGASNIVSARINLQIGMNEIPYTFTEGWTNHNNEYGLKIIKFSNLIIITGIVRRTFGTNNSILILPNSCQPTEKGLAISTLGMWNQTRYNCYIVFYRDGNVVLEGPGAPSENSPLIVPSVINMLLINAVFVTNNP